MCCAQKRKARRYSGGNINELFMLNRGNFCRGAIIKNALLALCSRRGLLAYVYSGVSSKECIRMNALVAGTALI